MKTFTASELAAFDGAGGTPVYVAYQGKVYDVTNSSLWTNGQHLDE
ncbi:MAG: cytochrome B5, partial [Chloroflexi bacterium]|nr:cytochrome B5 [Chloroflexota bacterium]